MIKTTLTFEENDFYFVDSDLYGENNIAESLKEEEGITVSYGEKYGVVILESEEMLNFKMYNNSITLVTKDTDWWDLMVKPISINIEF